MSRVLHIFTGHNNGEDIMEKQLETHRPRPLERKSAKYNVLEGISQKQRNEIAKHKHMAKDQQNKCL